MKGERLFRLGEPLSAMSGFSLLAISFAD